MILNFCANSSICSFIGTKKVNVICLHALHPQPQSPVSLPVMSVVSGLTLQWDSSLQHYRPDRTTHCDLQLLLLQGHLDHNHCWTLSIRSSFSLSLLPPSTCCMFAVCLFINTHFKILSHANPPFRYSLQSVSIYIQICTCTLSRNIHTCFFDT